VCDSLVVSVTLSPSQHTVQEGDSIAVQISGNGTLPDGLLTVGLLQGDTVISGKQTCNIASLGMNEQGSVNSLVWGGFE